MSLWNRFNLRRRRWRRDEEEERRQARLGTGWKDECKRLLALLVDNTRGGYRSGKTEKNLGLLFKVLPACVCGGES